MAIETKEVVRLYRMEDELMLTRAQVKHEKLDADLPVFTDEFPSINPAYVISYQSDINTALNFISDTAVTNQIRVLTEDLQASVNEGMGMLDGLDIKARFIYPDSRAKQRVFGQDTWDKARNDQQKMSKALKLAHSFANVNPYKADLLANGVTQLMIDDLLTIATNIDTKDLMQENAKSGRPVTTEDRIKVLNIVWKRDKQLATAAELVYRDQPAKLAVFRLYPPDTAVTTTVIVKVVKPGAPPVVANAVVKLTNTALQTRTTDAEGNAVFESTNMPDAVDVEVTPPAGGAVVTLPNQILVAGEVNTIEVQVA